MLWRPVFESVLEILLSIRECDQHFRVKDLTKLYKFMAMPSGAQYFFQMTTTNPETTNPDFLS